MFKLSKLFLSLILCFSLAGGMVVPVNDYADASCQACKVYAQKTKGKLIRVEPYYTPTLKNDKRVRKCIEMGVYQNGKKIYRRCHKYVPLCKNGTYQNVSLYPKSQSTSFIFRSMNEKAKKKKVNYITYVPWNLCVKSIQSPQKIEVQLQRLVGKTWKTVSHTTLDTKKLNSSPLVFSKEYGGKNLIMGANYRFLMKCSGTVTFNVGVGKYHPADTLSLTF